MDSFGSPGEFSSSEDQNPQPSAYPEHLTKGWTKSKNSYTAQGTINDWKKGLVGTQMIKCDQKAHEDARFVLMIGETGSGKSTTIDSMMNYYYGVDFEDKFRYRVVKHVDQTASVTSKITLYHLPQVPHQKVKYPVTFIDTMDFGDTRGQDYDEKTTKAIKSLVENDLDKIDAICFTITAEKTGLTYFQDYILSLFAKDVSQNIFLLITFCDGKTPPVLKAINKRNIPYVKDIRINNSAFFTRFVEDDDDDSDDVEENPMTKMFWKMGMKAFESFFKALEETKPVFLEITKMVKSKNLGKFSSSEGQNPQPCEYPIHQIRGWKKLKNSFSAQGIIKIIGTKGGEIDVGKPDHVYFLRGHIQHDQLLDVGVAVVVHYHKYVKGKRCDFKACEVRRLSKSVAPAVVRRLSKSVAPAVVPTAANGPVQGSKNAHCITLRGHTKPQDGTIKAKTPIRFDLKSVDVRPAGHKLTAGMVVYVDFNIDSQGGLYTEHIVALEEERLKERTYSEGVVQSVNSSRGFGKIMADVTFYYKIITYVPSLWLLLNDEVEVEVQAKIVSPGRLSAVSLRLLDVHRGWVDLENDVDLTDTEQRQITSTTTSAGSVRFGDVPVFTPNEVTEAKLIGKGQYSKVFRVKIAISGKKTVAAMKCVSNETYWSQDLLSELLILSKLKPHPNLLLFYGVVTIENRLHFLIEHCERGTLDALHDKEDLTAKDRFWKILGGVLKGLAAFHQTGLVHRDIACRNLLMKADGTVVLGDYGSSKKIMDNSNVYKLSDPDSMIPWAWCAPESLLQREFSQKSDIWMFGVTVWEILTKGKRPQEALSYKELRDELRKGRMPLEIPEGPKVPLRAKALLNLCFKFNIKNPKQKKRKQNPVAEWNEHDIVNFIKTFSNDGNRMWAKCIKVILENDIEYSMLEDCNVELLCEMGIPKICVNSLLTKLKRKISEEDASAGDDTKGESDRYRTGPVDATERPTASALIRKFIDRVQPDESTQREHAIELAEIYRTNNAEMHRKEDQFDEVLFDKFKAMSVHELRHFLISHDRAIKSDLKKDLVNECMLIVTSKTEKSKYVKCEPRLSGAEVAQCLHELPWEAQSKIQLTEISLRFDKLSFQETCGKNLQRFNVEFKRYVRKHIPDVLCVRLLSVRSGSVIAYFQLLVKVSTTISDILEVFDNSDKKNEDLGVASDTKVVKSQSAINFVNEREQERKKPRIDEVKSHLAFLSWCALSSKENENLDLDLDSEIFERINRLPCADGKKVETTRWKATKPNLVRALVSNCTILHYSGHGKKEGLLFDNDGKSVVISGQDFLKAIEDAKKTETYELKLLFLAACHSQAVGKEVAKLVDHVIVCKESEKLGDIEARIFQYHFYQWFFRGATILNSFEHAKESIRKRADSLAKRYKNMMNNYSIKGENETAALDMINKYVKSMRNEAENYVLIPADGDHNVKFRFIECELRGERRRYSDVKYARPKRFMPYLLKEMKTIERNFVSDIMEDPEDNSDIGRWVHIVGLGGVGKTFLAKEMGWRLSHDMDAPDAIFFIELKKILKRNDNDGHSVWTYIDSELCKRSQKGLQAYASTGQKILIILDDLDVIGVDAAMKTAIELLDCQNNLTLMTTSCNSMDKPIQSHADKYKLSAEYREIELRPEKKEYAMQRLFRKALLHQEGEGAASKLKRNLEFLASNGGVRYIWVRSATANSLLRNLQRSKNKPSNPKNMTSWALEFHRFCKEGKEGDSIRLIDENLFNFEKLRDMDENGKRVSSETMKKRSKQKMKDWICEFKKE